MKLIGATNLITQVMDKAEVSGGSTIFPRGCANSPIGIILQFFAENRMKIKEFEPGGEGEVPWSPLRSANGCAVYIGEQKPFCGTTGANILTVLNSCVSKPGWILYFHNLTPAYNSN